MTLSDNRIKWSEQEWLDVATELLKHNPEFLNATNSSAISLKDGSNLRAAIAAALPPERRRAVPPKGGKNTFTKILLRCYAKMRAERPGAAAADVSIASVGHKRVFWTEQEWLLVAQSMARRFPRLLKAQSAEALDFLPSDVEHAQTVLPAERRRTGKLHTIQIRPRLFEALIEVKRIKEERAAGAQAAELARQQAVVQADDVAPDERARALDAAFGPADDETDSAPQSPSAMLDEAIKLAEKKVAQRLADAEQAAQAHRTQMGRVSLPPAPEPQPEPAAAAPQFAPAAGNVLPETNLYEAAFGPLVKPFMALFAHEIGKALLPQIAATVAQQLKEAVRAEGLISTTQAVDELRRDLAHTDRPVGRNLQLDSAIHAAQAEAQEIPKFLLDKPLPFLRPPTTPRVVKPSIGILGNRNTYKEELQKEFPELEIICIDTHKKIPSIANCTKAISMVNYIAHAADKRLKTATGLRYVPLNGNLTDLKRVIAGWVASGALLPGNAGVSGRPMLKEPQE